MAENLYYGQVQKTRFLNPYEAELVISILNKFKLFYKLYLSHENAERRLIFFSEIDFNLEEFLADSTAILVFDKKNHELNHRDVLGALMSLGIERDLIGDILLNEDKVEISVLREVADFIRFNLDSIKKLSVDLYEKDSFFMDQSLIKFKDFVITISSLRLDSFVSASINTSRSQAKNLILKDYVKLNYQLNSDPSSQVNESDSISIRGHGRYYFQELLNKTRKDKYRLSVRKLI